jgi:Cof subfamily protein (haloacid dehalogenase superfamily)
VHSQLPGSSEPDLTADATGNGSADRIGLILIDIDGTLVGPGNVVPKSAWDAIDRASADGRHVALCTGRPCSGSAVQLAERVAPDDAHIFQSGAVLCFPDGRVLASIDFPHASYSHQVGLARGTAHGFEVYTATDCYVERHTEYTLAHAREIGLDTIETHDLLLVPRPIIRVQWVVPWDEWSTMEALIARDPALEMSVASHPDLVETCFTSVTAKGISKASAAEHLARHYGLTINQVAMIGDGDNDIAVLRTVGLPIAMGNATAGAKAVADHVVRNVDDHGLAEAIDLALRR